MTAHSNALIIALDVPTEKHALAVVAQTKASCQFYKIGLQLYTACGPSVVQSVLDQGVQVFLDLKLHDIPNTAASAVQEAAQHHISFLTVHGLGGPAMLRAAQAAALNTPLQLLTVSVLTHHSEEDLSSMGFKEDVAAITIRLLQIASDAGIHGCICSPQEAGVVRSHFGADYLIVTPGVRPSSSENDDQTRIATPKEAILAGANHVVIGRPIVKAVDMAAAARAVQAEIQEAFNALEK